ncbi:hypothetical protein BDU57DRAFT_586715 [Ampelomyces quisqualis]|uniref:Uncharacterized protein n=1 Tax=Ampelomyces quisqualis TaxID=50730 RepID=A0A6A5QR94_AMPQU|nr:hypothetical protein BDU57DRAFT_586715 [Ampelomyces quisqualis]
MKVTFILLSAAAAVMAQSVDSVSATVSGVCEPHNDHWHCPAGVAEPTTPPALVPSSVQSQLASITSSASHDDHDNAVSASTCEPHNDHWHCPSGVSKPATPPAVASTCSPHGDHWHCPSGVAKPATPPAQSASTTGASGSAARASASPSASQFPGAAAKVGSGALAIAGAVGAWIL